MKFVKEIELQFVKEIDHEIAKKNLPLEHRASQRE
jgi:hypothetical protein